MLLRYYFFIVFIGTQLNIVIKIYCRHISRFDIEHSGYALLSNIRSHIPVNIKVSILGTSNQIIYHLLSLSRAVQFHFPVHFHFAISESFTEKCRFGGVLLISRVRNRMAGYHKNKILLETNDEVDLIETMHGSFCYSGINIPFVGRKMKSLVLPHGKHTFAFYGSLPYFKIDIYISLEVSPCEGIINTCAQCQPHTHDLITHIFSTFQLKCGRQVQLHGGAIVSFHLFYTDCIFMQSIIGDSNLCVGGDFLIGHTTTINLLYEKVQILYYGGAEIIHKRIENSCRKRGSNDMYNNGIYISLNPASGNKSQVIQNEDRAVHLKVSRFRYRHQKTCFYNADYAYSIKLVKYTAQFVCAIVKPNIGYFNVTRYLVLACAHIQLRVAYSIYIDYDSISVYINFHVFANSTCQCHNTNDRLTFLFLQSKRIVLYKKKFTNFFWIQNAIYLTNEVNFLFPIPKQSVYLELDKYSDNNCTIFVNYEVFYNLKIDDYHITTKEYNKDEDIVDGYDKV